MHAHPLIRTTGRLVPVLLGLALILPTLACQEADPVLGMWHSEEIGVDFRIEAAGQATLFLRGKEYPGTWTRRGEVVHLVFLEEYMDARLEGAVLHLAQDDKTATAIRVPQP